MSGKVPPSSRAGLRASTLAKTESANVRKAAKLYERFTGHAVDEIDTVFIEPIPKVVAVIGECAGILYNTVRDGVFEKYIHEFAAADRPLLCVSPDGRQILLVGGEYDFTEKGIVDASDKKNSPRNHGSR